MVDCADRSSDVGNGRGHPQIDIGNYHYHGGALLRLLIHAIEKSEQRDHKKPTGHSKQSRHPTETRCGLANSLVIAVKISRPAFNWLGCTPGVGQVRNGLTAGEKWIRTSGSACHTRAA